MKILVFGAGVLGCNLKYTVSNAVATSNCASSNGNACTLACSTSQRPALTAVWLSFRDFSTLTGE